MFKNDVWNKQGTISFTRTRSWKSKFKTLTREDVFKKNVNPFNQKIQVSFSKALRKKN